MGKLAHAFNSLLGSLEFANDPYQFPRSENVSSPPSTRARKSPILPPLLLTCRSAGPKDVVRMALAAEARACGGSSVLFRKAYPQWLSTPSASTRRRFFFSARSPRALTASWSAALDEGSDSERESITATTPPRTLASHPGSLR